MINVITTAAARQTLEKRLVSCIQIIGPIASTYWWRGRIEEAEEFMGIMKTRRDLYADVEREIRRLHPYELPQIEAVEAAFVLPEYARWVVDETAPSG
jgi:periplasmic divalent cation tolerance protein